jgi:DNA-binding SARP family transcriptional activator/tetratricopeptide (TPR) repeat protein
LVVVELRLLGPVELWAHGKQVKLPSTKLKLLLAALVWNAGEMVPISTLVRLIWDEEAPPNEKASLYAYVSRLRTAFKTCEEPVPRLDYVSLGYQLLVPVECIDVHQLTRNIALAHAAADRGEPAEAVRLLRSAEQLVHGEPLAGLPGNWARECRDELNEQIHSATLLRVELQLAAEPQSARDVLPALHGLAAKREFDESVLIMLMRALQLAGRGSEALQAYDAYRERLRERNGQDPGASVQRLFAQLLRVEPARLKTPTPKQTVVEPPDTLEADPLAFVGRGRDVGAITAEIDSQLAAGTSVVYVIDGTPGVGKTTLALHLAHRLRGRCPDGAMQLHLRGHDEQQRPTDPETALGLLLGMLGAEPRQIQHAGNLDLAISLWRRHSAGKRLLLLLDDAAGAEQIVPLIPNGAGSVVLVTARNRLTGLPEAMRHPLEPMSDDEGGQLFVSSARMGPTTDPALRDVVAACGGFPLALAVAGNILRTRRAWSIRDLADQLANSRAAAARRPDAIMAPLFRVFSTSYRDLPEFERVLLRRLSLNPGLRIHLRAAAALVDAEPLETDAALFNLVEQNLLMEPERNFYQLHDMMRIFAAHACEIEEDPAQLEAAANRLVYFAVGAVDSATKLFHPHRHIVLSGPAKDRAPGDEFAFSDTRQATSWLDAEQSWLRTATEYWFANGHPQEAAAIVHMMSVYLDRKSLWRESVALHEKSLTAWRECRSPLGQAHTLTHLAAAHWRLGETEAALERATEARHLWTALDDPSGEADALLQMGRAHYNQHHNAEAIECFTRCARHWQEVGDHRAAAVALHHLCAVQFDVGHYSEGIATAEEALEIAGRCHDLPITCNSMNSLGIFLLRLGDYARAEHYYRQALLIADQIGDSNRIAAFALNLAVCQVRLERPENALPLLERAHETFSALGDRYYLTSTLIAQAEAHLGLRRTRSAQAVIDSAAVLAEQLGDPSQLARVHLVYGQNFVAARDYPAALHAFELSLDFARKSEVPYMEGLAYGKIGDVHNLAGRPDAARGYWRRALAAYGDLSSQEVQILRRRLELNTEGPGTP